MLSKYCFSIVNEYGIKIGGVDKLVPNLKVHVVQCKNRLLCLLLGIKFVSQKIFSEKFVAIHEVKPVLTLNNTIYVRFSILDLSKYLFYEFHYKYIKSKFDAKLLLTDTEGLVYETKTEHVYTYLYQDKNFFDFIDYPLDSKFFHPVSKKVIGKMEDEFKGRIISAFIELKPKMYLLIM